MAAIYTYIRSIYVERDRYVCVWIRWPRKATSDECELHYAVDQINSPQKIATVVPYCRRNHMSMVTRYAS